METKTVKFNTGGKSYALTVGEGETLLDAVRREGLALPCDCGGRGRCGKCRVVSGGTEKLACREYPRGGEEYSATAQENFAAENKSAAYSGGGLYLALDIGTTTVALRLVTESGETVLSLSFGNPQRVYGADVVSRLSAAAEGKAREMQKLLTREISARLSAALDEAGIGAGSIRGCAAACNTVMAHILMGYDCGGLCAYPFTPQTLDSARFAFDEIFEGSGIKCDTYLFPGISAFVGGDITAGLYACGFHTADRVCAFTDLGTNGEMAIGNRGGILAASVSAGPVFEGACISCGTGSYGGAIDSLFIAGGRVNYTTVSGGEPTGLCGSGVIDTAAALLRTGAADRYGNFRPEYAENGYPVTDKIRFTRDDMRQVQTGKAAVAAGLRLLEKEYGAAPDTLFIAGGFGAGMNVRSAERLGLIPAELASRAVKAGNTALAGAVKLLMGGSEEDVEKIKKITRGIELAADDSFNELFIENMNF